MKVGDKVKVIKLLNDQGIKITPTPELVGKIGILKVILLGTKFTHLVALKNNGVTHFRKKELKKIRIKKCIK